MSPSPVFSHDLSVAAPLISLALAGLVVLALSLASSRIARTGLLGIALAGLAACLLFCAQLWDSNLVAFGGMLDGSNYSLAFNGIFVLGAALSILLAMGEHEGSYLLYGEYLAVTLFATAGMSLMASSGNLVVIFIGLETLSISLYVLAGMKRTEAGSLEAAFKYFLLGAFASAFLLYGIAFVYGATGSLSLSEIAPRLTSGELAVAPLLIVGVMLVVVGLGFKIAMFPFHMWAPDVYQGAPTPIAAFMSTGSKAAGFAVLLRVLASATGGTAPDWGQILSILAILTMFIGNIAAISQKNLKRMLAYSSIAHAGYVLVGVVAWNATGTASVLFYLLAYTLMNVGAFGVVSFMSGRERECVEIEQFNGLAFERPAAAIAMAVFMLSLAGLPPTSGFVGKFYLFSAAVKAGHIPLVIFAVINSMISLYYYLGVVVVMFMKKSETRPAAVPASAAIAASLIIAAAGTLALGLFPSYLMDTFAHFIRL